MRFGISCNCTVQGRLWCSTSNNQDLPRKSFYSFPLTMDRSDTRICREKNWALSSGTGCHYPATLGRWGLWGYGRDNWIKPDSIECKYAITIARSFWEEVHDLPWQSNSIQRIQGAACRFSFYQEHILRSKVAQELEWSLKPDWNFASFALTCFICVVIITQRLDH